MHAVGTGGEVVRLVDAATGELQRELQGKQGGVERLVCVSMSLDGRVVTGVSDHGEHWKL